MGGHIAARFTIEHPERVLSVMLINAAGVTSPHPSEFAEALQRGQNPLLVSSVEDFDRVTQDEVVARGAEGTLPLATLPRPCSVRSSICIAQTSVCLA